MEHVPVAWKILALYAQRVRVVRICEQVGLSDQTVLRILRKYLIVRKGGVRANHPRFKWAGKQKYTLSPEKTPKFVSLMRHAHACRMAYLRNSARYQRVCDLAREGWSIGQICKQSGIVRESALRYLKDAGLLYGILGRENAWSWEYTPNPNKQAMLADLASGLYKIVEVARKYGKHPRTVLGMWYRHQDRLQKRVGKRK